MLPFLLALLLSLLGGLLLLLVARAALNYLKPHCSYCGGRVWAHEAELIVITGDLPGQKRFLPMHKDCVTKTWHKEVWSCQ